MSIFDVNVRLCRRYPRIRTPRIRTRRPQLTSSEMHTDRLCGLDGPWRRCRKLIMVMGVLYEAVSESETKGHMVYKCLESRRDSTHHHHHKYHNQTQSQA